MLLNGLLARWQLQATLCVGPRAGFRQISVNCGARYPEESGDGGHRNQRVSQNSSGLGQVFVAEGLGPSAFAATGKGGLQSGFGPLLDDFPLELGECPGDGIQQPAFGGVVSIAGARNESLLPAFRGPPKPTQAA